MHAGIFIHTRCAALGLRGHDAQRVVQRREPIERGRASCDQVRLVAMPSAAPSSDVRPVFLFAHGAGAPSSSPWMVGWKKRLATLGPAIAFDYPYMRERRRTPDRLPHLIAAHREALTKATAQHAGPAVLAGKSMGSRVGCHLALEEPSVRALVCFGYPLKSPGKKGAVRDEVLLALRVPILFLQGTRDSLCPVDLLEGVRKKMQAPSTLHLVEGGDHSLNVSAGALRAAGEKQSDVDDRVLAAVAKFLRDHALAHASDESARGASRTSGHPTR